MNEVVSKGAEDIIGARMSVQVDVEMSDPLALDCSGPDEKDHEAVIPGTILIKAEKETLEVENVDLKSEFYAKEDSVKTVTDNGIGNNIESKIVNIDKETEENPTVSVTEIIPNKTKDIKQVEKSELKTDEEKSQTELKETNPDSNGISTSSSDKNTNGPSMSDEHSLPQSVLHTNSQEELVLSIKNDENSQNKEGMMDTNHSSNMETNLKTEENVTEVHVDERFDNIQKSEMSDIEEAKFEIQMKLLEPLVEMKECKKEEDVVMGNSVVMSEKDHFCDEAVDLKIKDVLSDKCDASPVVENGVCNKVNGEETKEKSLQPTKRFNEIEINEDLCPSKKLCQDVEKSFQQHDHMISDYIKYATKNNVDAIQGHADLLLTEINSLRELAQKKEQEWNNILHLKKVKEEILLRLLRKKQVLGFERSSDHNGLDSVGEHAKNLTIDRSDEVSGVVLKPTNTSSNSGMPKTTPPPSQVPSVSRMYDMLHSIPDKPVYTQPYTNRPLMPKPGVVMGTPKLPCYGDFNGQFGFAPMGRQGPTKDVKSIIADYRQKNPEQQVPRRGRRMRSMLNPGVAQPPRPQTPHDNRLNDLGLLLNSIDMSQKSMLERLTQSNNALNNGTPGGMSFKDVLVQFANMQQNAAAMMAASRGHETFAKMQMQSDKDRNSAPPPPYPEISLHPVTSSVSSANIAEQSSLLHGILTKQKSPSVTPLPQQQQRPNYPVFSPTLAKLLKERADQSASDNAAALVHAKNCGEITITPVNPLTKMGDPHHNIPPMSSTSRNTPPEKSGDVVQLDDEESGGSEGSTQSRRLIIDESPNTSGVPAATAGGDVPLCQGCRRRHAQFVCAGCANQWYCSRECQVAAWDDHSEMCSG